MKSTQMILIGHGVEIRRIGAEDVPAVLDVYRQCEDFLSLGPQPRASLAMVEADLQYSTEQGGLYCGIFLPDGSLIGVVDFVPSGFEGDPACADLSLLMIAASYRGAGIGAAVTGMIETHIRRDPTVTSIRSGVQVNNPSAIRFWKRMGYQVVGGPELMPDQTTVYHLRKELSLDA